MNKRSFPVYLLVIIVLIAFMNALANEFYWYWRIWWFDMLMHFLGGLWVGLTTLWFFYRGKLFNNVIDTHKKTFALLASATSVLLIGLLWELFEFGVNAFITLAPQNSTSDTLSDLTFDLIGSFVAFILYINTKRHT